MTIVEKLRNLGLFDNGILPCLIHQSVCQVLEQAKSPERDTSTAAAQNVKMTLALLSLTEHIVGLPFDAGLNADTTLSDMLSLISCEELSYVEVLDGALKVISNLLTMHQTHSNRTSVQTYFRNMNGLDALVQRLLQLVKPLPDLFTMVTPEIGGAKGLTSAPRHVARHCVGAFLKIITDVIRRNRQWVRLKSLDDGTFTRGVIQLWKSSVPGAAIRQPSASSSSSSLSSPPSSSSSSSPSTSSSSRKKPAKRKKSGKNEAEPSPSSDTGSSSETLNAYWSHAIYSAARGLVCALVQNYPTCLQKLHQQGLTKAFLASLQPVNILFLSFDHLATVSFFLFFF